VRVIFGLGNPGRQYQFTRHNIGFLFLDYLQNSTKIPFNPGKGDYYFGEVELNNKHLILVKPTTYMNLSGKAVVQVLNNYEAVIEDILIVYDDYNLPFGTLRFRSKGSAGGHNGIKSIIEHLDSENFSRLKIGIGSNFEDSVDFVLSRFNKEEKDQLEPLMRNAHEALNEWLLNGINSAMNRYNRNVLDPDNQN
jgi:PTH1 family peptidyl-tRNA hydrolase